jgi:hypothetical protein
MRRRRIAHSLSLHHFAGDGAQQIDRRTLELIFAELVEPDLHDLRRIGVSPRVGRGSRLVACNDRQLVRERDRFLGRLPALRLCRFRRRFGFSEFNYAWIMIIF